MKDENRESLTVAPPSREIDGARISVFSGCIEMPTTREEFFSAPATLDSNAGLDNPDYLEQFIEAREYDGILSCYRHERVHFFQSLMCPIVTEYAFCRRLLTQDIIENLRNIVPQGTFQIPFRLKPQDTSPLTAYAGEPLPGLSVRRLVEGLALFYQAQFDPYQYSYSVVTDTMANYWQLGSTFRVYSSIYHDLASFWGPEQAYWLFPLVCWTSLSSFTKDGGLQQPVFVYVHITNLLSESDALRGELFRQAKDFYYQTPQTMRLLIEALEKTGYEYQDPLASYDSYIGPTVKHWAANDGRPGYVFFPHSFYIDKMRRSFRSMDDLLMTMPNYVRWQEYEALTVKIGNPPVIFEDFVLPAYEIIPEADREEGEPDARLLEDLTTYQMTYHTHDGIISGLLGEPIKMMCRHTDCPLFDLALCSTFPNIPENFEDCGFPSLFESEYGIDPDRLEGPVQNPHYDIIFEDRFGTIRLQKGSGDDSQKDFLSEMLKSLADFTEGLVQPVDKMRKR